MRQQIDTAANLKRLKQQKQYFAGSSHDASSGKLFSRRAKTLIASAAAAAILFVGAAALRAGGAKANFQAGEKDRLANTPLVMDDNGPVSAPAHEPGQ